MCPAHGACFFLVYTAKAPGCSAGYCPKWALRLVQFPGLSCSGSGSWVVCKGQTQLSVHSVPFSGPRSLGDQVLGKRTLQGQPCILITSLVPAVQCPRCAVRALSQVWFVSPLGS